MFYPREKGTNRRGFQPSSDFLVVRAFYTWTRYLMRSVIFQFPVFSIVSEVRKQRKTKVHVNSTGSIQVAGQCVFERQ